MNIIRWAFKLVSAAERLVERTRGLYYAVMLMGHACPQCHGNAPAYNSASLVHHKHAAFDCSRCHGGNRDLAASDGVHTGLKWFGAGAVLVVLTGILLNSFVINKKGKAR